jgi:hypothetical protein
MTQPQGITTGIRYFLWLASLLVFIAGVQLYIYSGQTDRYFAWTINPPLTAAFLGAGYFAVCIPLLLGAREKDWVIVRGGIIVTLTVTTLALITTLLHLDRFHTDADEFITWLATWVWIVVYVIVPPGLGILFYLQVRAPGTNPPAKVVFDQWLRWLLIGQGVIALIVSAGLLIAPESLGELWPWTVSALTGRIIGAWLGAASVIALTLAWENDYVRCSLTALAFCCFGVLELIALLRYSGTVEWEEAGAWLWTALSVSYVVAGFYIWYRGRRAVSSPPQSPSPIFGEREGRQTRG